ncbi:MAG: hypothetical protein ACTSRS_02525 [Candidatus Helarchaeota archaeon]
MAEQEGNRDNLYSFEDYLFVRQNFEFYADDEYFQTLVKHYVGEEFENIDRELRELSRKVSYRWKKLADEATYLQNRLKVTQVRHYDAFNRRIDRIERYPETETLEQEIFQLGLLIAGNGSH